MLSYLRKDETESILVVLNMSAEAKTVNFKLQGFGIQGGSARVLLAAPQQAESQLSLDEVKLAPYAALIAKVK